MFDHKDVWSLFLWGVKLRSNFVSGGQWGALVAPCVTCDTLFPQDEEDDGDYVEEEEEDEEEEEEDGGLCCRLKFCLTLENVQSVSERSRSGSKLHIKSFANSWNKKWTWKYSVFDFILKL